MRGEVVGLAGLMGAGRTEFAMSVFGRAYGTRISGRVIKDGKDVTPHSVGDAIRSGIAYATEDRKRYGLNLIEDIKTNIASAALGKVSTRGVVDSGRRRTSASGTATTSTSRPPTSRSSPATCRAATSRRSC